MGVGRDYTLYAKISGYVKYTKSGDRQVVNVSTEAPAPPA